MHSKAQVLCLSTHKPQVPPLSQLPQRCSNHAVLWLLGMQAHTYIHKKTKRRKDHTLLLHEVLVKADQADVEALRSLQKRVCQRERQQSFSISPPLFLLAGTNKEPSPLITIHVSSSGWVKQGTRPSSSSMGQLNQGPSNSNHLLSLHHFEQYEDDNRFMSHPQSLCALCVILYVCLMCLCVIKGVSCL